MVFALGGHLSGLYRERQYINNLYIVVKLFRNTIRILEDNIRQNDAAVDRSTDMAGDMRIAQS